MSSPVLVSDSHHDVHTDHGHHDHHKQSFITKYIFSTDHKMVAKQFMLSALFFLLVGGALALLLRWQLAYPGEAVPLIGQFLPELIASDGVIQPGLFIQLTTMHASVMIFFVIIPLAVGLYGNLCIPLMIGTDDMALPFINLLSFWLYFLAGIVATAGFFVQGGAGASGWTGYPPLSAIGGMGQTLWIVAVFLVGFSSILGGMNYVTTVLNKRAPGMKMFDLPLSVWAIFITSILMVLGTPVLASAVSMLFFDNVLHTSFFMPDNLTVASPYANGMKHSGGGQPILFQHLFWFYSHPAVYIMILPLMGVVSDILATFSRKPIYGYKAMIFALMAIAFLGFIVWGHHMFQSGMNPLLGTTFMLSTIVIAVPSAIKIFNWLGTIWRGSIRYTTANLMALGFIATFIIGGLSGVFMASAPVDIYIHDTYFIVAHIHYVLFGGSLFGIYAGIYYWFPKLYGKMLNEIWGRRHFFWTFTFFNLTFFPMHILGVGGHMRRIHDPNVYDFLKPFQPWNEFITIMAIILGFSQLILFGNIIYTWIWGPKAPKNPWNANTLEWHAPSPPPHGNFLAPVRVYRSPYEFSHPERVDDFHPQWLAPGEVEIEETKTVTETHSAH